MAWTTPILHSVGDVLTASDWNITSNDVSFLGGATAATIGTSQSTSSTSYADLGTVGPSVTLTTGAHAIVALSFYGGAAASAVMLMSAAVSGATTIAAADGFGPRLDTSNNASVAATMICSGLTPGSNTFTAKYRVTASTCTFANRAIAVWPLP